MTCHFPFFVATKSLPSKDDFKEIKKKQKRIQEREIKKGYFTAFSVTSFESGPCKDSIERHSNSSSVNYNRNLE